MAKRRSSRDRSLDKSEDTTNPDHGEGAVMAAVDQHEAEMKGEAAPKQVIDTSTAEATQPPPPRHNFVAFRVFEQVAGMKWDQLAGFKSHVKRTNLGPMSIEEWHLAYAKFMGKPVK